jgi:hypothetical protein
MLARGLQVVQTAALVLLLAAGGSSWSGGGSADATGRPEVVDTATLAATQTAQQRRKKRFQCHGLKHRQVRGQRPDYTRTKLAEFRNHKRVCRAAWLPEPRNRMVPQGLAVSGTTAWISGYLHSRGFGKRPCRLMRVHLMTGRLLDYRGITGRVGKRPVSYCRHGGGLLQRGKWLWVAEKNKLWLVDPTTRGRSIRATRAWRIEAPVRGSAIVGTRHAIGLVPFQRTGRPYIHWFSMRGLLRRGVVDLGLRSEGRKQLGAGARTAVPTYVQGATIGPDRRLYLTRSSLACGELVTPWRTRIAFVPGAEGISFGQGGRRLWAVSESGAKPYRRMGKPLTPAVTAFEWPRTSHARRSTCF